jgi:hypothetical protein
VGRHVLRHPDGGPDAVGRSAACGPVPFAEYRGVVLSHRRPQDCDAVDASRRAGR